MKYYCNLCKKDITSEEYDYSIEKFRRALCRYHQKLERAPQNNHSSRKKIEKPIFSTTPEARKLHYALKKAGVPAELEKWDGHKHIDIAITEAKVNIEVDGAHHNFKHTQALADLKRTLFSFKKGYLTLRIPNSLIKEHFDETVEMVVDFVNESAEQLEEDDSWWNIF